MNRELFLSHVVKMAKLGNIRQEEIEDYILTVRRAISKLNKFLRLIIITDDNLFFVSKFMQFLDELKEVNEKVFSQLYLQSSIYIMEDLEIKYQKRNFRYNKMHRIESSNMEDLIQLKKMIILNMKNDKLKLQFQMFFMSLANYKENQTDSTTLEQAQEHTKVVSYGQKNYFKDLTKDTEAYKKLMRKRINKKIFSKVYIINSIFSRYFRTPLAIQLNLVSRLNVIALIVCTFFVDWFIMIYYIICIFFHTSVWIRAILWGSTLAPYFLVSVYSISLQIIMVTTSIIIAF